MRFSTEERQSLLAVKGVGPTVIARLEQMGFSSLAQLADADADDILTQGALLSGSSCWKNSPQARAAVQAAIHMALEHVDDYRAS
ncbi:Pathogenicity locus [Paucibacter sp. KBW04]|uniref:helix-hairpin-helix domain-containing protein n=1 Tax=Paucibacter sp. KBW04 TaxID=2153361 RepID=UPI000F574D34|nr:helix-hairpin-helix domain-containing protein [Paucibacter sp. KBW04]RQO59890.1 Pathogenicity locus [Paucibacter sp. KBW04]